MPTAEELIDALDMARATARVEYRKTVLRLARHEAGKAPASDRKPADVDDIHHARTRVIALDAAHDELRHMAEEGVPFDGDG